MCGIIGAVGKTNISCLLLKQLELLEYRGYDSAGVACINDRAELAVYRTLGKVKNLVESVKQKDLHGQIGVAHTRWATHGKPSERNAHPQSSGKITLVHNGIIENNDALRLELLELGYKFSSDTDTEVVAHFIHYYAQRKNNFLQAVYFAAKRLKGSYALAVINQEESGELIALRNGSPLIVGLGEQCNIVASDQRALAGVCNKSVCLQDGEFAIITADEVVYYNNEIDEITKQEENIEGLESSVLLLEKHSHYMHKEIHEQPHILQKSVDFFINDRGILKDTILKKLNVSLLSKVQEVHIVACGTSYNAGLIASYWFEQIIGIPCRVHVASEYSYYLPIIKDNTLFVAISQSGETADTLMAIRQAKKKSYLACLAVCNVWQSQMVKDTDDFLLTYAGVEVGVASTKAFTSQLVTLYILVALLRKSYERDKEEETYLLRPLQKLGKEVKEILLLEEQVKCWAKQIHQVKSVIYLARGRYIALAQEGALKLKEISYIHAESYAAGELKHGPLALIDEDMPVVVLMPFQEEVINKVKTNIKEILSRSGKVFLLKDKKIDFPKEQDVEIINIEGTSEHLDPILYAVPLQLLAYHVALLKGTDIDQPRNLAKSVTVE